MLYVHACVPLCTGGVLQERVRDPLQHEGVSTTILLQSQIPLLGFSEASLYRREGRGGQCLGGRRRRESICL